MSISHQQLEEAPARRLRPAQQTAILRVIDVPQAWPRAAQRRLRARPGRLHAITAGLLLVLVLLVIAYAMLALR